MFRWYRTAAICYAYLSDVNDLSNLEQSRWFTRGWTLQELVAPKEVLFYSSNWALLASKLKISDRLSKITNIDVDVLETGAFNHVSIAARMSWAATRQATRLEDTAYCLMGIFDVNMPLLYGEGKKSFIRLQEEIIKVSNDSSLFAWGLSTNVRTGSDFFASQDCVDRAKLRGPFADSPMDFSLGHQIKPLAHWTTRIDSMVTKGSVQLTLPTWTSGSYLAAATSFTLEGRYDCYLCIPLMWWDPKSLVRWGELVLVPEFGSSSKDNGVEKWEGRQRLLISSPTSGPIQPPPFDISGIPNITHNLNYVLEEVYCLPHARYSAQDGDISFSAMRDGPQAVLFFRQKSTQIRNYETLRTEAEARYGMGTDLTINYDEWNSGQTRFAIILGRDTNDSGDGCWMKLFHILDEKRADENFHYILRWRAELVQHCMTRSQLISAITDPKLEKSFLWDSDKDTNFTIWIQHREEPFAVGWYSINVKREKYNVTRFQNIQNVFVDARLQLMWKNLEERKAVLSMEIYAKEKEWQRL